MTLLMILMACDSSETDTEATCPSGAATEDWRVSISHADQDMAESSDLVATITGGPADTEITFDAPLELTLEQGEAAVQVSGTFAFEGPNDTSGTGWSCTGSWERCVDGTGGGEVDLPLDCEITWQD